MTTETEPVPKAAEGSRKFQKVLREYDQIADLGRMYSVMADKNNAISTRLPTKQPRVGEIAKISLVGPVSGSYRPLGYPDILQVNLDQLTVLRPARPHTFDSTWQVERMMCGYVGTRMVAYALARDTSPNKRPSYVKKIITASPISTREQREDAGFLARTQLEGVLWSIGELDGERRQMEYVKTILLDSYLYIARQTVVRRGPKN